MSTALKLTPAEEALLSILPEDDAAEALRARGLPHRRVEEWKWTDLRASLREPKALSTDYKGDISADAFAELESIHLIFANGQLVTQPDILPPGLSIKQENLTQFHQGTMSDMAARLAQMPITICIEQDLAAPLILTFLSDGQGMHHTHVQLHIAEKVSCDLIEEYTGDNTAYFSNGLKEYFIGAEAKVKRTILQGSAPEASLIESALIALMDKAEYEQVILGFGGKLVRFDSHVMLGGEDIKTTFTGGSLLSGRNHLDHTFRIDHKKQSCETHALYKAVLRDQARGVFQGKFLVERAAQLTDAQMQHKALLLSDKAEINAKPELEIYADDVQCAHGNTAGALDKDALFYLRQRGLNENQSRALLIEAFMGEVLETVPSDAARAVLSALALAWMGESA